MKTRKEFLADPSRSKLSPKEQNKRWAQYRASQMNKPAIKQPSTKRGTKLRVENNNLSIHLSHCAKSYLGALMFPFSTKQIACIPDLHAVPSRKVRVKTRGTFSTGANGWGWIVASPWCTSSDNGVAGYTTAPYTAAVGSPIISPAVVTPNLAVITPTKLPFPSSAYQTFVSNGVQARVVGTGLRIRYIGSEMARSGQIVALRHLDNETLAGLNANSMRADSTAKTMQNDREWHYVVYRPTKPTDYEFSPYPCVDSEGPATNYKYPLGFLIEGTTNTTGGVGAAPFEFELIQYVEYIGEIGNLTSSHVDVVGMSDVRNSMPDKSAYDNVRAEQLKLARALTTTIADRTGMRAMEIQPALNRLRIGV